MGQLRYARVGRRWRRRARGFRISSAARFCGLRLRIRFLRLMGVLTRCVGFVKRSVVFSSSRNRRFGNGESSSKRFLVSDDGQQEECRLRYCRRSNSFYAEAIADCLEFIKRSSVSVRDESTAAID